MCWKKKVRRGKKPSDYNGNVFNAVVEDPPRSDRGEGKREERNRFDKHAWIVAYNS